MHVALNGWFWNQPTTGSGQYVRNLTTALTRFHPDMDLTLIVPGDVADVPDGVGVERVSASGKVGKVLFEQRSYPRAVKRIKADVAHVPYWGPPLTSPARLVVSVLDVIPLVLQEYRGGFFAKLYTSLVATGARGAGHILTLSNASKQDIVDYLEIPPEKVTATYLAADERFSPIAQPADEDVRQRYDLPDDFALYFGGFDIRKNVNTLLLAWTYVGQAMGEFVPLVLAGRRPQKWGSALFPDLEQYARDLKIDKNIIWLGEVAEEDKPALYRLAKVMVWPSLYEGFGLPPLEAMASGTPVVAGDASSTPEVVGNAAYIVDAKDAREMGGAILALLVQDDLHQQQANLARGHATQFSWRKTANETVAIYQQVLEA